MPIPDYEQPIIIAESICLSTAWNSGHRDEVDF